MIYCSDDKKRWNIIDYRSDKILENEEDLLDYYYYKTQLPIMRRFIKLQNLKCRLADDDHLIVHRIEFFGTFFFIQ